MKPCAHPGCSALTNGRYCAAHEAMHPRPEDVRGSAASRGYGAEWRKIRIEVLKRAGLPPSIWKFYDVDHNPPYNPAIEPDHRKYQLAPRLHGAHSRKTACFDGGWGRARG
jgi:5-methylcytosine-specific restriction enzyme A